MNNIVVMLDNQFETLSSVVKAAWTAAATPYLATPVCGCQRVSMDSKKLYRLTNYMRLADNQPVTSTPPGPQASGSTTLGAIEVQFFGNPLPLQVVYTSSNALHDSYFILQLGRGLNNPIVLIAAGQSSYTALPGDPLYELWTSFTNGQSYNWCGFEIDYGPTGTGVGAVIFM